MKLSMFPIELCWDLTLVTSMTARIGDRGSSWGEHLLPCRQKVSAASSRNPAVAREKWATSASSESLQACGTHLRRSIYPDVPGFRFPSSSNEGPNLKIAELPWLSVQMCFELCDYIRKSVCYEALSTFPWEECFFVSYQRGPLVSHLAFNYFLMTFSFSLSLCRVSL